jgi:hypothetical protein
VDLSTVYRTLDLCKTCSACAPRTSQANTLRWWAGKHTSSLRIGGVQRADSGVLAIPWQLKRRYDSAVCRSNSSHRMLQTMAVMPLKR